MRLTKLVRGHSALLYSAYKRRGCRTRSSSCWWPALSLWQFKLRGEGKETYEYPRRPTSGQPRMPIHRPTVLMNLQTETESYSVGSVCRYSPPSHTRGASRLIRTHMPHVEAAGRRVVRAQSARICSSLGRSGSCWSFLFRVRWIDRRSNGSEQPRDCGVATVCLAWM